MAPLGARGNPQVKVTWVEFIMLWLKKLTGPGTEKKIIIKHVFSESNKTVTNKYHFLKQIKTAL